MPKGSTSLSLSLGHDLSSRAFRFAEDVLDCSDMDTLCQATQDAILTVGMTAVASGLVSGPRRVGDDVFHFVNWPADWLEIYLSHGYLDKDPVPRWAIVSGAPISWTGLLKNLSPHDPGHEVYANAARWGFNEGFVTPVRSLDGSFGLVSVGGERVELHPPECLFLQSISVTAFHRAETIASSASNVAEIAFQTLDAREALTIQRTMSRNRQNVRDAKVRELFALTPAEWRIVSALYEGESLQGLAAVHKLSINTLRVQLASVFAKTRTHRQTELVSVIRSAIDAEEPLSG